MAQRGRAFCVVVYLPLRRSQMLGHRRPYASNRDAWNQARATVGTEEVSLTGPTQDYQSDFDR